MRRWGVGSVTLLIVANITTSPAAAAPAQIGVATTGNGSERIKTLPIVKDPSAGRKVVISMGPRQIPSLHAGDVLKVSAEFQVSTDCRGPSPRCHGHPYHYSPIVSSRLVITRSARSVGGNNVTAISDRKSDRCLQKFFASEHHCVTVFSKRFEIPRARALPCALPNCRINLVTSAHSHAARRGDKMVVGIDRPDGRIVQDKGRINVVRIQPGSLAPARDRATHRKRVSRWDIEARAPKVLYSLRLPSLRRHEQFAASARMVTSIAGLPYDVFIGSQLIVAPRPGATGSGPLVRRMISLDGEVDEGTGFNCTRVTSPCETRKVGVFRVRRDAPVHGGRAVPLYLNLVGRNGPKSANDHPGDAVRIRHGGIKVTRYPPQLAGLSRALRATTSPVAGSRPQRVGLAGTPKSPARPLSRVVVA
jgi:hypothetical protein